MNYKLPHKILTDNSVNLTLNVVEHYIKILTLKHCYTMSYHLCINEKVENLNRTLEAMLIKYLINKLTKL